MKEYYERRWLNIKHGRAFSIASIDVYDYGHVDTFLSIGDCSQSIELEFSFETKNKPALNKQLKKMDKFIEACQKLRAAMVEAHEAHKDDGKDV